MEKVAIAIEKMELVNLLKGIKQQTLINLTTSTVVRMNKKNNPFYGKIVKHTSGNYMFASPYEKRVNNNRENEGLETNFEAEKPKGMSHVSEGVLVSDTNPNQYYIRVEFFDEVKSKSVYKIGEEEIAYEIFQPYLPPLSESKKQELDRKVKIKNYKVESINTISVLGKKYKVV